MEYLDMTVNAWLQEGPMVGVLVNSSPVGGTRSPVSSRIDLAQAWQLCERSFPPKPAGVPGADSPADNAGRVQAKMELGQLLTQVLFPQAVSSLLTRSLDKLSPSKQRLRLRLCLDKALFDLPWELLRSPEVPESDPEGFLVLDARVSLVREAARPRDELVPSTDKQRLAFVGAMWSSGDDRYGTRKEFTALTEALQPVLDLIDPAFEPAGERGLERALNRQSTIFHYAGHIATLGDQSRLTLTEDVEHPGLGTSSIGTLALRTLLASAGCRLAMFSACFSSVWTFIGPLLVASTSELAALVAVHGSVTIDGAIVFARALYQHLALGLTLDEAVSAARTAVREEEAALGVMRQEWASFMVCMPTTNAVLFPKPDTPEVRQRQEQARRELQGKQDRRVQELGLLPADIEEVRILFLAANPLASDRLQLDEEARQIELCISQSRYGRAMKLTTMWAVRGDDLQQALLNVAPHIVHFAGHGAPQQGRTGPGGSRELILPHGPAGATSADAGADAKEESAIIICGESGTVRPLSQAALVGLFRALPDKVRVVMLNACYTLPVAQALVAHIDVAVGTRTALDDQAAIGFAKGFYRGLGNGLSVQQAMALGVSQIAIDDPAQRVQPQMVLRSGVNASELGFFLPAILRPGSSPA